MASGSGTWGPDGGTAGTCMACGEPARSAKAFYCEEHRTDKKHGRPTVPRETTQLELEVDPEVEWLPEGDKATAGDMYAERAPTEPKVAKESGAKGLLGKFWSKDEPKPEQSSAPKTTERKPAAPKKRVSTADFWGDCVGPVSTMVARTGYVPMARAMEWTSPVVGEIVENATRGTLVDKAVQPFVRNAAKWQDLSDLLGFWASIGLAQRNPAAAPQALDFARKRLVNLLPRIATNIRKERAKEKAAVEALVELMPDIRDLFPDAGPDDDPVGLLIQSLFAAPEPEPTMAGV